MEIWSKRISAPLITIIGGEPTLHPDLDSWVKGITQAWPGITVMIQTNGTVPVDKFGFRERYAQIGFGVAVHSEKFYEKFPRRWDNEMFDATKFTDCALIDQDNRFTVHDSDPDAAFKCCTMRHSHTLLNGRLYKCPMPAVLPEFRKQYQVDLTEKQATLLYGYQSLGPECSDQELEDFVAGEDSSIPQCRLCPSQFVSQTVTMDPNRKKRIRISRL